MMRKVLALRLLAYAVTAYLTVGVFFFLEQSRLLFPAPKTWPRTNPADAGLAFENLNIKGMHAWWIPYSATAKTAIVFHGNGYVIDDMVGSELTALRALDLNLLLVDYRGYGGSSALTPTETTILEDADAALGYLTETRRIEPSDVFVIGRSIGSGPAVYLASKRANLAGLILESPFSGIDDAARAIWCLRIYPVGPMLHTHFDNLSRIASVRAPVFIVVGSADDLTPPWMARKLFDRAHGPKKLMVIDRAGHNDLIETGSVALRDALLVYLSGKVKR